jgi:hypothetical protein
MIAVRVLRERVVVHEYLLRQLPATIGRGAGNDVVLFDASVSRRHARLSLSEEGCIELVDLGSTNGIHRGPEAISRLAILGSVRCRLGVVELEIEPLVEGATIEVGAEEWQRFDRRKGVGHHLLYLALGVAGWLTLVMADPSFWSPWQKQRLVMVLWGVLGMLIALPVLCFTLLVLLRAAGRAVRMSDTLRLVAQLVWLWPLIDLAGFPAYYVLSSGAYGMLEAALAVLGVVTTVVLAAGLRRRRPSLIFRLTWALAVTALALGFVTIAAVSRANSGAPHLDFHVQPPILGLVGPARSLDSYVESVRAAAQRAERAAAEERRRQERE